MSVHIAEQRPVSIESLASEDLPEKFVELIAGELVHTTPAGKFHNRVASNFELLFRTFCADRPDLDFGGDNEGFLLRRNPDTLLSPDACLFRRRPAPEQGWMDFAPEIVVEVLSPANHPVEILYKRKEFFSCGTEQFWIADPQQEILEIWHRDGRLLTASADAVLAGEGLAEGMSIPLPVLFAE
jgi:Uma2 family endonuclease